MDSAFKKLTTDEELSKIDIDPRLIPSFKRVMERMSNIFEANEYLELKDYNEFFNKYLLHGEDTRPKLTINMNDEPSKTCAAGFYDKKNNNITIDRKTFEELSKLGNTEEIDHILFHEFTHFIVSHDLNVIDANEQIYKGGFIDEALTEMFTIKAFNRTSSASYIPQVKMLEFANLISGNQNNYRAFLRGGIDAKLTSASWKNFEDNANNYQNAYKNEGFKFNDAIKDYNYISAQRCLISTYYTQTTIDTLEKYFDMLDKLSKRPIEDKEAINKLYKKVEEGLLRKYLNGSSEVKTSFENIFNSIHENMDNIKKYGDKKVYEFDFEGEHIIVDENGELVKPLVQHDNNHAYAVRYDKVLNISINGKTTSINLNSINYVSYQEKLDYLKTKLTSLLTMTTRKDIEAIDKVSNIDEKIIRLERFTLPIIGLEHKNPKTVYIAYYKDGIKVLTDYPSIGNVDKINVDKYIGLTSPNPEQALIVREGICQDAPGVLYTTASKKYIEHLALNLVQQQMEDNLKEEDIKKIFEAYKQTSDYDEAIDESQNIEDAIYWYSTLRLNALSEDKKQKLYTVFKNQADKFIVTTINGIVSVAKVETPNVSYIADKEVLIDNRYPSFYNDYYETKRKQVKEKISNEELITELDNGKLISNQKQIDISSESVDEILDETRTIEPITDEVKSRLL